MTDHELERVLDFLFEMGLLKRSKRTGWWAAGVGDPESIADHSFRTALVGYALATLEGADGGRTGMMCLLHDTQETRIGDIPAIGKPYAQAAANEHVTDHQTSGFPAVLRGAMVELVEEYEKGETIESRLAHDADKLELVLQAREYQAQAGYDTGEWLESGAAALKTQAARRLAELAREGEPGHWWHVALDEP